MRLKRFLSGAMLLCIVGLPQLVAAAPACMPPIEVAHAKAIRIEKNGAIVLVDGRAVRLEGLLLPAGASDHAPHFLEEQALSALTDLTVNRTVDAAAAPPKEDRYGRLRAQVVVRVKGDEIWVQKDLLRKGLARAAIAPDRNECVEELYAAENDARRDKAGIWSSEAYALRRPAEAGADTGTFQIVQGTVAGVSASGGRVVIDFAEAGDSGFRATISAADMKRFREIGVDPLAYANAVVRVRGWVERIGSRTEIALATPAQVEIVRAAPLAGAEP